MPWLTHQKRAKSLRGNKQLARNELAMNMFQPLMSVGSTVIPMMLLSWYECRTHCEFKKHQWLKKRHTQLTQAFSSAFTTACISLDQFVGALFGRLVGWDGHWWLLNVEYESKYVSASCALRCDFSFTQCIPIPFQKIFGMRRIQQRRKRIISRLSKTRLSQ